MAVLLHPITGNLYHHLILAQLLLLVHWSTMAMYVEVCSESNAKVVYYTLNFSGTHGAVKENTPVGVKYLSKYGNDGPLVGHNLNDSYYHYDGQVGSTKFYTYIGRMQGPGFANGSFNITGTSVQNFNVLNVSGVTYTWSQLSGYQNAYISSGQGTNSILLTPTHSGTTHLKLVCKSTCGAEQAQIFNINITTNICLEGVFTINSQLSNLNTSNNITIGNVNSSVTCPNASSFTWVRTSGSITNYYTNNSSMSFAMVSGGTISFLVTAKNGSQTLLTRNVTFYHYGSFRISPNPSQDLIAIDLNPDLLFDIVIYDFFGKLNKIINSYNSKEKIDISNLKKGEYMTWIYHENKLINKVRFIVEK